MEQTQGTQGSGNAAAQLTVNTTAQGVGSAAAQTGLDPQAFMMKAFLEMQQTLIKLQAGNEQTVISKLLEQTKDFAKASKRPLESKDLPDAVVMKDWQGGKDDNTKTFNWSA